MQDRAPGIGQVRVGPGVEEPLCQLEVPVQHGRHERSRLVARGGVDVGAGGEQRVYRVDVSLPHGEQQRRELAIRPCLDVGPGGHERRHGRGVARGGGPHQRRLAAPRLGRVHGRAGVEQRDNCLDPSGAGSEHQGRIAARARRLGVGVRSQQQLDHNTVAVGRGQGKRCHPVAVRGVHARTGVDQPACRLHIVASNRPVQRRRAVRLGRVRVGPLVQ